jgi:hypothetical protein
MLTCTTELEAVNSILEGIGEQPVNSIPTTGISEATLAYNTLQRISRQVQTAGLHCNTDKEYPLSIDQDGKIPVPNNCLKVDPSDQNKDIVRRGGFLYDRDHRTFVFTDQVECDIVFYLAFTDLPEPVRQYIVIKAARVFQKNVVGSEELHSFTAEDEFQALAEMKRLEVNSRDDSMLNSLTISPFLRRYI